MCAKRTHPSSQSSAANSVCCTGRAQHRLQTVALCAQEVTALHPVLSLKVAHHGLAALEVFVFFIGDWLELALLFDCDIAISLVYSPAAQTHVSIFWTTASSLHQDAGLLHSLFRGGSVTGVGGKIRAPTIKLPLRMVSVTIRTSPKPMLMHGCTARERLLASCDAGTTP